MRACLLMSLLAVVLAWAFHTRQVAAAQEKTQINQPAQYASADE